MTCREIIADRINTAVSNSGKRPSRIADECGIGRNTMSAYMAGKSAPGADILSELCKAMHVSADWLLGLKDNPAEREQAAWMESACRLAVQKFGQESQIGMLFEEMAELQDAVCKQRRGRDSVDHIAEEIADVEIMLEQLKEIYHCHKLASQKRCEKIERLRKRLGQKEGT